MPAVKISPVANGQLFNNNGVPLAGGKIFAYEGGSYSALKATYSDHEGTVQNPNPIVLDATGRLVQPMWLEAGELYNIVVTLPDGTTVLQQWSNIVL